MPSPHGRDDKSPTPPDASRWGEKLEGHTGPPFVPPQEARESSNRQRSGSPARKHVGAQVPTCGPPQR